MNSASHLYHKSLSLLNVLSPIAALDSSRPHMDTTIQLAGISHQEDKAFLRNRFVTGDWGEGKKRSQARPHKDGEEVGVRPQQFDLIYYGSGKA